MALHGVDLSHHNSAEVFDLCLKEEDFIILKATEGRTYRDPMFTYRQPRLVGGDVRRGYYHYARPENNNPEEEVNNFLATIGSDARDALLILDWEGNALRKDFQWALDWCNILRDKIKNARPILYASASTIRKYANLIQENDLSVWTAHYNYKCANGCVHDGSIVEIMTQYISLGVDRNIFHADTWERWTANRDTVPVTEKIAEWTEGNCTYVVTRQKK